MATGIAPFTVSGGTLLKAHDVKSSRSSPFAKPSHLTIERKLYGQGPKRRFCIHAEYSDQRGGSGSEFVAGFLLGGAIFGTLAYAFAPQIRRAILNEDEHGFRRPRRLVYYDDSLEKNRLNLKKKIRQLNSAIDNISFNLRASMMKPPEPIETSPKNAAN